MATVVVSSAGPVCFQNVPLSRLWGLLLYLLYIVFFLCCLFSQRRDGWGFFFARRRKVLGWPCFWYEKSREVVGKINIYIKRWTVCWGVRKRRCWTMVDCPCVPFFCSSRFFIFFSHLLLCREGGYSASYCRFCIISPLSTFFFFFYSASYARAFFFFVQVWEDTVVVCFTEKRARKYPMATARYITNVAIR